MRILIVKTSSLGDIVHAFPVLEYLKTHHPQAQIDWVVEQSFAELVGAHPMVDRVIPIQTKKWRSHLFALSTWKELAGFRHELRKTAYDLVLDLQGNSKSGLVTGLAKSVKKVGFDYLSVPEWPNLLATNKRFSPPPGRNIREDYLFLAESALECFNLETAVQDDKIMQDFGLESPITRCEHSQEVKTSPIISGYSSKKDCVNLPSSNAVSGFNEHSITSGVKLSLSEKDIIQLQELLDQIKPLQGLKVLVCSGSNWPNKQLSKENLKDFLQIFSEHLSSHFLLVWGNQSEKTVAEEILSALPQHCSILNRLSLPVLQNLMTHVDLVLAMDSLPLHLAGISSTPTYSVFGPSSAKKYKPFGKRHEALQGSCPYDKTFEKRCDILRSCKTGACMKQLQGEEIFKHFHSWWMALDM